MEDMERLQELFQLLHKPIPWDPIPPWAKVDDRIRQEFSQLEVKFAQKELELQQQGLQLRLQKLQEVVKVLKI